jgi:uncharacterized membrane protein YdbT with pleckstrin-like domain
MALELREGEREIYQGRPSWRALMSFYAGGLGLAVAVLVIVGVLMGDWGIAVVAAAALAVLTLLIGWLRRLSTKYMITSQRLRISKGIVSRRVQETRLDRVQNVNYDQGVLDRMLGVGTVDFDTAGTDDSEFRFDWVNGPDKVVTAVNEAIHESETERDRLVAPPSPGAAADRPDVQ